VDARDRLRRYLEQRRELGESEFVLDGLPVEDVLAMVGARTVWSTATRVRDAPLGACTVGPADRRTPSVPPDVRYDRATRAPPAPVRAAEPERRFPAKPSTDWREALRNAGAGVRDWRRGLRAGADSLARARTPNASAPSGATTAVAGRPRRVGYVPAPLNSTPAT
jgi:hypothetical protein